MIETPALLRNLLDHGAFGLFCYGVFRRYSLLWQKRLEAMASSNLPVAGSPVNRPSKGPAGIPVTPTLPLDLVFCSPVQCDSRCFLSSQRIGRVAALRQGSREVRYRWANSFVTQSSISRLVGCGR